MSARIKSVRTTRVMYWLFGAISGGGFALGVITTAVRPNAGSLPPTVLMGVVFAVLMCWLATTSLRFSTDEIEYRSLLVRRRVLLREILQARFESGFVPFSYKPFFRVVLVRRDGSEIVLNGGLFNPKAVRDWVDALNSELAC